MDKQDEIQKKLIELELAIDKQDQAAKTPAKEGDKTEIVSLSSVEEKKKLESLQTSADLHMFGGIALLVTGLLMVFTHVQIGTSMMSLFGFGPHMGIIILPMLIGIGMLFYNYKSKLAQTVTAAGVALILFTLLTQLIITFPMISMLGMIFMVLPLLAGSAFIAKAMGKRKEIEQISETK